MGSHGKLSKDYHQLGSNAVRVVKKVDVPVLITKDAPRAGSIDKVVFASGFDVVSARAFDLLLDMMESSRSEKSNFNLLVDLQPICLCMHIFNIPHAGFLLIPMWLPLQSI